MTTTVVCPLSGDSPDERALPSAFDAAELLGSPLELFSTVEDVHMVGRRRAHLAEVGAKRRPSTPDTPDTPILNVIVEPHTARAIAARAAQADAVMVMATSSQPLLHAGYIGSAAERTTREAHHPVVLIGPHNETRLGEVERVVVACDGSQLSESALPEARRWADRLGVALWVVTSIDPHDVPKNAALSAATEPSYVRRLATGFDAEWEVLHGPDPAKSIVRWAGPALIAMTTHGRSGLSRITIGSVTTAVTRWATGPVVVANGRQGQV